MRRYDHWPPELQWITAAAVLVLFAWGLVCCVANLLADLVGVLIDLSSHPW